MTSYLAPISQRNEIVKEMEGIVGNTKFFSPQFQSVQPSTLIDNYDSNIALTIGNMLSVQNQMKTYHAANGNTYTGACANATVRKALSNTQNINGGLFPDCSALPTKYAVASPLYGFNNFWCVDSTGFAGEVTTSLGSKSAGQIITPSDSNTVCK